MFFICKSFVVFALLAQHYSSHVACAFSAKDSCHQGDQAGEHNGSIAAFGSDAALQSGEMSCLELLLYAGAKILCIILFMF